MSRSAWRPPDLHGWQNNLLPAIAVLIAVFGAIATVAGDNSVDPSLIHVLSGWLWASLPVVFVLCGALIVRKQPRNAIGWMLILPGLVEVLWTLPVITSETPPPRVDLSAWLQIWVDGISWMLLFFPVFHLLLIFPTGRLLSPRWRWAVALEVTMLVSLAGLAALSDTMSPSTGDWTVDNPIGVLDPAFFDGAFSVIWALALILLTALCVLAVILRFRRGSQIERRQVKWLLLAVSVFALIYTATAFNSEWQTEGAWIDLLLAPSLVGIPVAIVIAVTRHRLYEIDRLVSRTLTYGLVTAFIASVIASMAGVIGTRFREPIVVAATTLAAAAMFNPLRRKMQTWVDRRFNRSGYDIAKVLGEFSASIRQEVDPDRVISGLVELVSITMQPTLVRVWMRRGP